MQYQLLVSLKVILAISAPQAGYIDPPAQGVSAQLDEHNYDPHAAIHPWWSYTLPLQGQIPR